MTIVLSKKKTRETLRHNLIGALKNALPDDVLARELFIAIEEYVAEEITFALDKVERKAYNKKPTT